MTKRNRAGYILQQQQKFVESHSFLVQWWRFISIESSMIQPLKLFDNDDFVREFGFKKS